MLRRAELHDLEALATIAAERDGRALADHRAGFEREIDAGSADRLLLVAELGGAAVAGFARATRHEPGPDAPANSAPPGWYLSGVIVDPAHRRRGIAAALTRRRLGWIAERAGEAFYFANARNLVSIDLHAKSGFVEVTRDFVYPGASFTGGTGILFRADLVTGEWTRWPDPRI